VQGEAITRLESLEDHADIHSQGSYTGWLE
jgi:hypothetical protein